MMNKLNVLNASIFILVFSFYNSISAQEKFTYQDKEYKIYPHKRECSPSWWIYSSVNRDNKKNIEILYRNDMGAATFDQDEEELAMNISYYEMDVFSQNYTKLKGKVKSQVRKHAKNLFHSYPNLNQTITPSIDPLPDGKYVQFYKNIFDLDAKGDIQPVETHVAGFFELKNNLLQGYSYWLSTSGDTIEEGYFDQGQRIGKWIFNKKEDFWDWDLDKQFDYDKTICNYKNGLLDGEYIEYDGDSISNKGFYTASEPSGEWFFYDYDFTFVDKVSKMNYYLQKHFTYVGKNDTLISNKILIRNTINRNIHKSDTITMPPNIYSSQIEFNQLFKFYKPTIEDLELPEEKMTSYEGENYGEEGEYYGDEPYYGEGEGYGLELDYNNFNPENKVWIGGKQYTKAKLIDSIGINFKYKDVYEEFYPSGKLKYRYKFKNGELVSEDTVFWDNGIINDLVEFNPTTKIYAHSTFDYAGKLVVTENYDSLGNFINTSKVYERYPTVMIDGLKTEFHAADGFYLYTKYDTLLKANVTTPMYMFKSWYFDKKVCAESFFEPASSELTIKINSLNGTLKHNRKLTFGEDYSFYSQRIENNLRDLQAVILSNASYDATVHNDSFPQSKIYYLRYFNETDDYTLNYKGKAFTGKFDLNFDSKSPKFSIQENKVSMDIPSRTLFKKINKDYINYQKTGKAKFKKYYDILDIGLNFDQEVEEMFPFINKLLSEINYNSNDYYNEDQGSTSKVHRIEGQLENGKPVGKWLVYDLDGTILRETMFENGERQGDQKTFAVELPKPKEKKHKKNEEEYYYDEMYYQESIIPHKYPEKKIHYLKEQTSFNKGLQSGPEKYFDWEGNILYAANYKDGYMEGPVLERNEIITTRSNYKDGLLDGIVQTKLTLPGKDSITLYDLNFQNHQLQGESKSYHTNGKIAKRGFFLNNDPIDDYEAYDTLGFKYHYVKFLYTFPVEEKIWEENELSVRYLFNWQDSIYFRPNDLVEIPSTYDLLMQYGLMDSYSLEQPYYGRPSLIDKTGVKYHVTKYFPSQIIARDGPINSGKKVGCWYYNNYAGQKLYDIEYFDTILKINDSIKFKAKGIRTDFDTLGNALHKSYLIEKIENYDCSHTDHYEVRQFMTIWQADAKMNRFNGYVKNHYDDGTLQSEGNMKDGLPTGIWKYYTPNGMLNQVGEYVQGKRNGRWLKGDLSKTNYIGDICMNPNLPDLEKRVEYQENLLDINIRYFKLGKIINSEFYDINMNQKK